VLHGRGLVHITESEAHEVLEQAIVYGDPRNDGHSQSQFIYGIRDIALFPPKSKENLDLFWHNRTIFSGLKIGGSQSEDSEANTLSSQNSLKDQLANCTDMEQTIVVVITAFVNRFAVVLNLPVEEIKSSDAPASYGLDSLISVQIRNWVHNEMGCEVSSFDIMQAESIESLAKKVAQSLLREVEP